MTRLRNVRPRTFSGRKRAGNSVLMAARRSANRDFARFERSHQLIQLVDEPANLLQTIPPFVPERRKRCEGRAYIAHRIADGGGECLRVALMPVRRVTRRD